MSIILTNLSKRFGHNVVVNNVSLEINDGELFVLLGGSGSGKSTILRLIAGLIHPDAGRIELNDRDVTFLPPQTRNTGFVFQNYSIFRHMTVADNVAFGLRIRKVSPAERRRRSDELLDLVGLGGLSGRYADQLSGGQQQRVALARALAYEPAVLLLDEPFGALDVKIRAQLRRSLREIQRQLMVTTILVTHDQEEAFELADRIGVVDQGRLIEVGAPETLYHRPQSEFTATFIGGGNVLVGRKVSDEIRLGEIILPVPEGAPPHEEGAPIRILFRPETVLLQPGPFAAGEAVKVLGQGTIQERTFAGSWQRLLVTVDNLRGARLVTPRPVYGQSSTPIEAVQPSASNPTDDFAPGRQVWLGLPHYHVLNPTGLKVLVYADQSTTGEAAAELACRLAQAAGGPITLLDLATTPEVIAGVRERLEQLRRAWQAHIPQVEIRVRAGGADQIVLEAQEGGFEVVVLGRAADTDSAAAGLGTVANRLLLETSVSVLFVQSPRLRIDRILICTAVGEPGKSDVHFGGRIARRMGAQVTVLHVHRLGVTAAEKRRIEQHLGRARSSLAALGVHSVAKAVHGPVTERILREAEDGDYDLIVIGAPAPPAHQQFFWPNLAVGIVAGTTRPVLVVPMLE
ncbi:MAG TPA: ATP-binding cassette domain-containing protein [Anaerolineae bacterium]